MLLQPHLDGNVFMNSSGTQAEPTSTSTDYIDPFDDVFGSAPASPTLHGQRQDDDADNEPSASAPRSRPVDHPSDVSRLRRIHVTNGYREGVAASKETHIQEGFNEGYTLGAEIALKAGHILGVLDGLCHALPRVSAEASEPADRRDITQVETRKDMKAMLEEAEGDMKVERLLGQEYFGADGVWIYDATGQEVEADVTFAQIAGSHPVIMMWSARVKDLSIQLGMSLD